MNNTEIANTIDPDLTKLARNKSKLLKGYIDGTAWHQSVKWWAQYKHKAEPGAIAISTIHNRMRIKGWSDIEAVGAWSGETLDDYYARIGEHHRSEPVISPMNKFLSSALL